MRDTGQTKIIVLSGQALLIATPDGRCWLTDTARAGVVALPCSPVAALRASVAASVVDGAISAGFSHAGLPTEATPYTLLRYIRWLVGDYIFAGQTPGLFRRGAQRLDTAGRKDLADFAARKADEEAGHADLAFRDLEALRLPAADVVRIVAPPSAAAFVELFRAFVESNNPIALFGFSYCLERMAAARDAAFIRTVEALCPPGCMAIRFLRVHSAAGSDHAHVHELLAMFEALSDEELTSVARAAYDTAILLTGQGMLDQALSDEEIERRLGREGITLPKWGAPGKPFVHHAPADARTM